MLYKTIENMIDFLDKRRFSRDEKIVISEKYKEITGLKVCFSCPGDLNNAINRIKRFYNMSNFRLSREAAIYRVEKGGQKRISNSLMSDELAVEFLKVNPDRIGLFSHYPENWEELILGESSDDFDFDTDDFDLDDLNTDENPEDEKNHDDCCDDEHDEPCDDCKEKKIKELSEIGLPELREKYPDIKARSKDEFIKKVVN